MSGSRRPAGEGRFIPAGAPPGIDVRGAGADALCREAPPGGRQVHGANIVAAMLARGERRPMTFSAAGFRRYGERIELVDIGVEM